MISSVDNHLTACMRLYFSWPNGVAAGSSASALSVLMGFMTISRLKWKMI